MDKILYNLTGNSTLSNNPSIEGSAVSYNMYTESNGKESYLRSIPGNRLELKLNNQEDSPCDGMYASTNAFFCATSGNIYKLTQQDNKLCSTTIGKYTAGRQVVFAESGGQRNILLWVDGYSLRGYDIDNDLPLSLTLPVFNNDLSIKPSYIACVQGVIVVNDQGSGNFFYTKPYPLDGQRQIFSIINGEVVYEPDGYTVKRIDVPNEEYLFYDDYNVPMFENTISCQDSILALVANGPMLTIFGSHSIEFWQLSSGQWTRTSWTYSQQQGLASADSVRILGNKIFFLGQGAAQAKSIMMIDGTSISTISLPWLDHILNTTTIPTSPAWCYSIDQHMFYLISIGNSTYVYDLSTQQWHIRNSRSYYTQDIKVYQPRYSAYYNGTTWCGCASNSNVFRLDSEYYYEDIDEDSKLPLVRTRQSPVIIDNYKPFVIHQLDVEANTGHSKDYLTESKALLQVSNDGGYTYGNAIESSLGNRGEYFARLRWLNLGLNRLCVLRITCNEPTDFLITNAAIRHSVCSTM